MQLKSINQLKNIKSKRVLLRLDLNVPIVRGKVADDFRIQTAIPTVNLLRDAGAKVIIVSHIEGKGGESLKPVADHLNERKIPVIFSDKYFTVAAKSILEKMKDGEVVLFENVRSNKGETLNSKNFAEKLAAMGDIYVNEAFSVSHRNHASIVGVPKLLPSYVGTVFAREVKNLSQAFEPDRPFLFILGGAKFETKLPLIKKFLSHADFIFVGGALANNFFKELNFEVGQSVVSKGSFNLSGLLKTQKVFIPTDVVVASGNVAGRGQKVKSVQDVNSNEKILDVGPRSLIQLGGLVSQAKFILWNGPLGNCEDGFFEGTQKTAEIIAKANAKSVIGGGDTVAAIKKVGLLDKFTFVSTGGGAMLDFLANETLPGIEAIKDKE